MRDAFINELTILAQTDPSILLMVGDLGYGVVEDFARQYPKQFLNAGIAEQNMMGMAAGMADMGFKPFVYSIANFPTLRCLEQVRNDVVYHNLPVCIVSVGAGLSYGSLGYSHQAIEDIAIMRSMPGIRIISPADPVEVRSAVRTITSSAMPTYLRLGKNGEKLIHPAELEDISAPVVLKNGSRNLVLVTGGIASNVLEALKSIPNDAMVLSVPMLKPLNLGGVEFSNFDVIVTVEEHSLSGGFNSLVMESQRGQMHLPRIRGLGLSDSVSHATGSAEHLRSARGLGVSEIITFMTQVLV